jgi:hypothetical protein
MSYTAEVSRSNPSCFLFLIDQSGSMEDPWAGEDNKKKADELAVAINRLLQNLVIKCAKTEGVRDYFHIGVIGYGTQVGPAFSGLLAGKEIVPISEVADSPARIEDRVKKLHDGAGGLVEQNFKFPVWFDSVANGGTPMCQAFIRANSIIGRWLKTYPDCFPPIVINITDGEATDGDPRIPAENLRQLSSSDGNVLLFNVHLSSTGCSPIEFPGGDDPLPDEFAKQLFSISSHLPEFMRKNAQQEGFKLKEHSRGFVFNADIISVIRFLDIGTRPSNLR